MNNDPFSKLGAIDQKLYQRSEEHTERTNERAQQTKPEVPISKPGKVQASKQVTKQERSHLPEAIYRKLQNNRYLTANTFRFRPEELEELNKLFDRLDKLHPKKVTKNDLVRVALNWLLEDYKNNEHESLLKRILARM